MLQSRSDATSARSPGGSDVSAFSSYGREGLPVSWVGIALILVACVFVAVDLVATNHGLPTVAAVVAFILGALTLYGVTAAYSGAMLAVLVALALLVGGVLVAGSSEALAARGGAGMNRAGG